MRPLVSVGWQALPEPSKYNAQSSVLVDSGRYVAGYMTGSVIRYDVVNIEITWDFLTARQWAGVLSCFAHSFYNDVTFFNQTSGVWETRTMYAGDPKAGMYKRHPKTGDVVGFTGCSVSFVEV